MQLVEMRGRGLVWEEIAAILERTVDGCRTYHKRMLDYRAAHGRLPDAGELYNKVNRARYFKPPDEDDEPILPPPEPDDGYRAPHRRIYDRLPPSCAELALLRAAERAAIQKH